MILLYISSAGYCDPVIDTTAQTYLKLTNGSVNMECHATGLQTGQTVNSPYVYD